MYMYCFFRCCECKSFRALYIITETGILNDTMYFHVKGDRSVYYTKWTNIANSNWKPSWQIMCFDVKVKTQQNKTIKHKNMICFFLISFNQKVF